MAKHSVSRLPYLFAHLHLLSLTFSISYLLPSDFLHVRVSSWLCFSICLYCQKFSFQTSFDDFCICAFYTTNYFLVELENISTTARPLCFRQEVWVTACCVQLCPRTPMDSMVAKAASRPLLGRRPTERVASHTFQWTTAVFRMGLKRVEKG